MAEWLINYIFYWIMDNPVHATQVFALEWDDTKIQWKCIGIDCSLRLEN